MEHFQSAMKCRNVMKCGQPISHNFSLLLQTQGYSRAFEVQTYAASHRRHVTATKDWRWCGEAQKKKWSTQSHQNSLLFDAVCHLTGTLGNLHSEARGYWKLFSKGIITSKFWNSAKRLALVHSAYNTLQSIITNSCHPMVHSNFNTHMAKLCRMCSQWL